MNVLHYDKLVRDHAPELLEKAGKKCVVETMDDETYYEKLIEKLGDENENFVREFSEKDDENALRSLADMEEIIHALVDVIGLPYESFERILDAKRTGQGTFSKKLLLKEVIEEDKSEEE